MAKLELIFLGIFLGILDVLYPSPTDDHTADGPVVDTMYGPIRGVYVQQGSMFLGVPFAAPPVGSLRWQPPQPPTKWATTYNATAPSAACIQHECGPDDADSIGQCPPSRERSEDCLYLNVFVPLKTDESKLPVIFWIHGGNFWGGSAMGPLYDGRFLANKTKTVVVAANYRLSALGFLVAGQGDGAATGNFGILDQIAALQWTQDNIGDFGGDKDRITIFGQSAGAYSVLLHMIVNKSDHLFHRAIAASPPLSLTFRSKVGAIIYGDDFTRQLNCTLGDMQCLRAASATQVLEAQYAVRTKIVNPFDLIELFEPWGPTVDGDLVPGQVVDAFENGMFQKKPLIIGSTTEEAIAFYGPIQGVYVQQGSIFLGIPFAAPPVGDLRWKPPQPPTSWTPSMFNATTFSSMCIPHTGTIDPFPHGLRAPPLGNGTSEDCLYLNVFAPTIAKPGGKLPVIFWIHGGNFFQGSAMDFLYDGRFLANSTKTVVVAANYRLSALGFLVTRQGEGAATGNFGILDQIAALQWIQDNIADFGGDKDRVTIYGQSAGAYSALLHMTLDKSDHLFHRAIASSPPPTLYFRTDLEARIFGDDFARLLDCTPGDMDCMRSASASQVAQAQNAAGAKVVNPFRLIELLEPWGPTIDGDLVRGQLMDLFSNGQYQQKPAIIGSTTEEGVLLVYDGTAKPLLTLEYEALVYGLFLTNGPAVLRQYPPSHSGDERPVASLLLTHYLFSCPIRHVQRSAAENGSADFWSYVFAHPLTKKGGWEN
ncbi:PREDICTED: uncharacterized protein LOC109471201 [Branchiostoma belcheri]|uniref:Uncharacterized protein LOC109471201 n=1 Tax=Branchiostoma belcheri TaxID=7741 RepID=A0A6P4Z4Q2_BRABE|nr:PREDICTED: uncharacterized protein LOC109471201 [Branchiostoma belcheri]